MQPIDFIYVVLPLGAMIILLVALILLMQTSKELLQDKKIKRAVEKLSKVKAEKQKAFKNQQEELDKLHENKSLDDETYERLSTLMRMNEKNLEDTMNALIYAENIGKKQKKVKMTVPQIRI
jgi:hypothetical protein